MDADEDQRLLEAVAEFGNGSASISRETLAGALAARATRAAIDSSCFGARATTGTARW